MDSVRNDNTCYLALVITFGLSTLPVLTLGCNFGASPDCLFPCHCADAGPCDPVNGTCAAGCDDGNPQEYEWPGAWSGPGCQIGNVAFQKAANLTEDSSLRDYFRASQTLDGVFDSDDEPGHCSMMLGYPTPSLTVDLGGLHIVLNVTTYQSSRKDHLVEVGYDDDWFPCHDVIDARRNTTYVCDPIGVLANRVRIRAPIGIEQQFQQLCEVMVWGYLFHNCSNRRFGPGCVMECHCSNDCDVISGACPAACDPGWNGTDCQQECPAGSWGFDCTGMCHCADPEEKCRKDTGMCTSGCAEGRMGVACDANCTYGSFGPNCERDCHCLEQCDVKSGLCYANCVPGWLGSDCQQVIPSVNGLAEITDVASDSMKLTCELWTIHSTYEIPPNAYRIQIRKASRLEWDPVQIISSRDADSAGEISVVLRGLDAATTYHVRVSPVIFVDGAEYSGDGVTVKATTLSPASESITPVVVGVVVTLIILAAGIGIAFKFRVHQQVKK